MSKSNYPDWVLKYKSKGVYVNKVGDKYYLYRAHCVYDKKTKKNVRVSDGYIGRVTEKDGFIPVRDKVTGPVFVFELGLYYFLSVLLKDVYKSFKNDKRRDSILSLGILNYLGVMDFSSTALFYIYKRAEDKHFNEEHVKNEADRVKNMLDHFISTRIEENDWINLQRMLPSIHLVKVNDKYYISSYSDELKKLLDKYNVEVK